MPVRVISSCCSFAIQSLPPRIAVRSSSSAGVEAVANQAAFLHRQRRLIHNRPPDQLHQVRQLGDLRLQFLQQGRASVVAPFGCPAAAAGPSGTLSVDYRRRVCQQARSPRSAAAFGISQRLLQAGNLLQRQAQRDQVPRIAGARAQPPERPFQVPHLRKLRPELLQAGGIVHEGLHRLLPPPDRLDRGQRLREPVAQPPRAHRRDRAIERAVKRRIARRVMVQRLQDFQVPQRREVERQVIAPLVEGNARQVRHVAPQVLRQVMQHRPRRPDGRRAVLQPEAVQRGDLEMLAHREQRRLRRKHPVVVAVQNPAIPRSRRARAASVVCRACGRPRRRRWAEGRR